MNDYRTVPARVLGGAALTSIFGILILLAVSCAVTHPVWAQSEILGAPPESIDPVETQAKIDRLEKKTPLSSENYRDQYELGNLYYDLGQLQLAEARYGRVLELNPKFIKAMVNLGSLYSDQGRWRKAVEQFEAALNLDPEDCKARSNLGNAYYGQERYPDAMYEYKRAIEIDPDCYSAHFNIAVAFADAGIFREAIKWWEKVVQIAPGTQAARQAQENIDLLQTFVSGPR